MFAFIERLPSPNLIRWSLPYFDYFPRLFSFSVSTLYLQEVISILTVLPKSFLNNDSDWLKVFYVNVSGFMFHFDTHEWLGTV